MNNNARLSISGRIILLFLISFTSITIIWFISSSFIEDAVRQNIGETNTILTTRSIEGIDILVEELLKEFTLLSLFPGINELITTDNEQFLAMENREQFMAERNSSWPYNPDFNRAILENEISRYLISTYQKNYLLNFGFEAFPEIFLTNKYGAVIASTGVTTNYDQSDELWWRKATTEGFYVEDVVYDESIQSYGMVVAKAIENEAQEIIGVLKGVLDISQLIGRTGLKLDQQDSTITITNANKETLFSNRGYSVLEKTELLDKFQLDRSSAGTYFDTEEDMVISFARSKGFGTYEGFGWIVVISKSLSMALEPFLETRETALLSFIVVIVVSSTLLLIVIRTINSPIKNFISVAESIQTFHSEIDFGTAKVPELKTLASVFNSMTKRLQKSFEDLEEKNERVANLVMDLKSSNDDLEQFAYIASHDLQEPLRKIRAFGDLLMQEEKENLSAEGKQYVEIMQTSAERMGDLIISLLNYSRINTRGQKLSEVSLNSVLKTVIQELELIIQETGTVIELHITEDLILGDRHQVAQIFQNLISNSIKFQKNGNIPLITIENKKALYNDTIRVSISDNGIGISPNYSKEIFRPFRKLHSRSEFKGSGIGLSICKKIMTRIGGEISLHDTEGEGTEFILTFRSIEGAENEFFQ